MNSRLTILQYQYSRKLPKKIRGHVSCPPKRTVFHGSISPVRDVGMLIVISVPLSLLL